MARTVTSVLHPKWWLLHLFTVAVCITMVLLGHWQWQVAHRHNGDIRYYAYAFQWWAFTIFALVMWYRIVSDYLRADQPAGPAAAQAEQRYRPAGEVGYRAYVPPAPEPEHDTERSRFNAYLRALDIEREGRE
ncbi:MAG TPA: hypothetical protein VHO01_15180 [Jatrophihabitans sp.]|nr:hypothetical protein [Jatrophihabitans sp.]